MTEVSTNGLSTWRTVYRTSPSTPVTTATVTTYGSNGARTETTIHPDGTSTVQSYAYGRLLSVRQKTSGGSQVTQTTYAYDPHGRVLSTTDASSGSPPAQEGTGGPVYTNKVSGRLATRVWKRGVTTGYTYNSAGELATIDYSDSTPDVVYTYDRRGRRVKVEQGPVGSKITTDLTYNDADQALTEAYTGGTLAGLNMAWTYDSALRRDTVTAKNGGTTQQAASYQYDTAGRLWKVSDSSHVATCPSIEVKSLYAATQAETNEVFVTAASESPTHDADGNLTADGRWTYTWDGENRLVQMIRDTDSPTGARQKLVFEYDHQGRRIRKTFSTYSSGWQEQSDLIFLYDGWNLVAELDANASNAKVRTYVWGTDLSGTMTGAGGVGGLLWVNNHQATFEGKTLPTGVQYAAYDGNGNVAALVKATDGSVTARYDYGPFAEPIRASGPMAKANPIRFSTKYTDYQSGLLYYGYRYYAPLTGRWLGKDPIEEEGGENLYAFAFNAPISSFDALGADVKGGQLLMQCSRACEDFKRRRYAGMEAGDVPNGAIVCCGGAKYICTWGVERESNPRARSIVEDCLRAHEKVHRPNITCERCSLIASEAKWKKTGLAACEEEVQAYTVGKTCFEDSLRKCRGDAECRKHIEKWINHEATMIDLYRAKCGEFLR